MRYFRLFIVALLNGILLVHFSRATMAFEGPFFIPSPQQKSVMLNASVQSAPPQITLRWETDSNATAYYVSRKSLNEAEWGAPTAITDGSNTFVDTNVALGVGYEYQIVKSTPNYSGYGYIYAGGELPATHQRGKVIVLVDQTMATALSGELSILRRDLVGDGWQVVRHDVPRHDTTHSEYPKQIKALIKADYVADPQNVKAVFIIGHVAVPYSGFLAPDEHDDHNGAWPADVYYGDMDGMWTDSYVTAQRATRSRNINLPGDGKFDQSYLPSNAELAVGRVDLADMTLFSKSELELTRQYLNKDHNFRAAVTRATAQALISDAFGDVTGGTADTAWRNFAPIIGTDKIAWGYWMDASPLQTYLWTYGSGSGWFEGCFGVGNAVDFDGNKSKVFFTLMFGSYFGDWNVPNNLLRAVIAQADYGLTAGWAGRPHWYFHPMALGETIGEGLRRSQNNDGTYQPTTNYVRGIHTALMGDPTLRMHIIAPPTNVVQIGNTLYWQPSTDAVLGYYVYSAPSLDGVFIQLNSQPVTQTSFSISANGASIYMVRAVRLESSPSGSYYNLSQGAFTANAQVTAQSYSTSAQLFLPAIYAQ